MKIGIVGTGQSAASLLGMVGPTPIKDHISAPPVVTGPHGKAWLCDIDEVLRRQGVRKENNAMIAHWIVEAPWAHPHWHSYSILVAHLRPMPDGRETTFYLEDATHQIWVFALDPDKDRNQMLVNRGDGCWLSPANFTAQFIEITDELAQDRSRSTVQQICDGKLSPDTDHISAWGRLYGTNMLKGGSGLFPPIVRGGSPEAS